MMISLNLARPAFVIKNAKTNHTITTDELAVEYVCYIECEEFYNHYGKLNKPNGKTSIDVYV